MEAAAPGAVSVQDEAVDKSTFKKCNQIAFYRRQKLLHPGKSLYRALLDSVTLSDENVKFQIIHEENKAVYWEKEVIFAFMMTNRTRGIFCFSNSTA